MAWGLSAAVMVGIAAWAGWAATHRIGGILIDTRGRYSLTRLQVSLWTILVVSLLVGVLAARATVAGLDPLDFKVPEHGPCRAGGVAGLRGGVHCDQGV